MIDLAEVPEAGPADRSRWPIGALVFDVIVVAFTSLIIWQSFGLRGGAGTVPLVVGIPTLLGALFILARDVRAGFTGSTDGAEPQSLLDKISLEEIEEFETPEAQRRQVLFAIWAVGFVAMAWITSFYIAVPVALLVLFVIVRLSPIAIIVSIGSVLLLLYTLFDLFLRVRL